LLIYHLAVFNEQHTWYAGHAIVDRQVRVLIHVYLTYIYFAFVIFRKRIDRRAESETRATPRGPEIYYRKFICFKHFNIEI